MRDWSSVDLYQQNKPNLTMANFLLNSLQVFSFSQWKTVFDKANDQRVENNIINKAIFQSVENENHISVLSSLPSEKEAQIIIDNLTAQATKGELVKKLVDAKVIHDEAFSLTSEVNTGIITILSHEVKDFDFWQKEFNTGEEMRAKVGIKTVGVFRSNNNPNFVTIITEVPSIEVINAFINNPELQANMEKGGVISKPEMMILKRVQ
jgi:hypothetical protein